LNAAFVFAFLAEESKRRVPMMPTILLVDVDSPERDSWKAFLQVQGFDVLTARDGDTAMKVCRRFFPDLVLLHDNLPDISGAELCKKLKADPIHGTTPVVLVVPVASEDLASQGREAGADDFWGAPTSRWEALSRMQLLLRLKGYIDEQAKLVVLSLAQTLDAKGPMAAGHSERLTDYALHLGESLNLTEEDLETLRIACLLHDIGKVGIPDTILAKPGPLSQEERKIVEQHPAIGENICAPLKSLRHVLPVIRHHHERMDGSGYPDGLRGDRIPLKARILQIADIYDALTTDRPYRDALQPQEALEVLSQEARRGWLDQWLVSRFSNLCEAAGYFLTQERSMLASYYA
jgi:putative two-component system response regulator